MKLIIVSKEDSVASLLNAVDIEGNEEKWLLHWDVQKPQLSPKAGIPPVLWSKEELYVHAYWSALMAGGIVASLKPFLVVFK